MLGDPSSSSTTTALQVTSRDPAVEVDASYDVAAQLDKVLKLVESTEDKGKPVYTKPPAKGNGGKDGMVKN